MCVCNCKDTYAIEYTSGKFKKYKKFIKNILPFCQFLFLINSLLIIKLFDRGKTSSKMSLI